MLDRDDAPPILCMRRLCASVSPSPSDTLAAETSELCREPAPVPLSVPSDPELVYRERDRDLNAPLILASKAALPFREPRRVTLGLGCDEGTRG